MDPRKFAAKSANERAEQLARDAEDLKMHWRVISGEFVNDGHGVYLTSDQDYGDIELYVDFKVSPRADSGVYLRGSPQIQVWDSSEASHTKPEALKGSGGLWNNTPGSSGRLPLVRADNPVGQWNTLRIIQVGSRTTVYLNDKLVVDHAIMENSWDRRVPIPATGPIQIQSFTNEVRWRNIKVREIPAAEANQSLARHGSRGFNSIFNERDMTGWSGSVDCYEVQDRVLTSRSDRKGTVYYDKEYSDFVARLEFQLAPGANNGLAIRYPGHGDPSFDGMCELQILDDSYPDYNTFDPRQFHGSAYGMVAARRGYLRPQGEWNFQEVTVEGSKIKVELNGTVILESDLSTINEFMPNQRHPGKDRTSGYFGLFGLFTQAGFRNISIKTLD